MKSLFIEDVQAIEYVMEAEHLEQIQLFINLGEEENPLSDPEQLKKQLSRLYKQEIQSVEDLESWIDEESELSEAIQEMITMAHINYKRYNDDDFVKMKYENIQQEIIPLVKKYRGLLNEKFYESPFRDELDEELYGAMVESRINSIELYNDENIELEKKERKIVNEYVELMSNMTVEWEGKQKTLQEMKSYLQSDNRMVRESAWKKIWDEILSHDDDFNDIMSNLISVRHEIAVNAGFDNYRDYIFKKYERTDYTAEDCKIFFDAVQNHIVPIAGRFVHNHQQTLGLEDYRPWDGHAAGKGKPKLQPFQSTEQLVEKGIKIFNLLDPMFGQTLGKMQDQDVLDLDNRKGKSPGGFCANLPQKELSFIYMNATGTHGDMTTLIHEGGHAVHNELMREQPLADYRQAATEVAELASMSMELFSMNYWDEFYDYENELAEAQKNHLEGIVSFFPWALVIDQFQHWMYENPDHTAEERKDKFRTLIESMSHNYVNMEGLEEIVEARWVLQHHIFEAPFYYIEYAIAQLGALQLWQNYEENPDQTIEQYKQALALGSSKSVKEVYEEAGIQFDFSEQMIKDVMGYLQEQLTLLEAASSS